MKTPDSATQLVIESLRSLSETRLRVAQRAAGEVQLEKQSGKDVRSSAVKVTEMLAHANTCTNIADQLEVGSLVLAIPPSQDPADVVVPAATSQSAPESGVPLDVELLDDDDADESDNDVAEFDLNGGDPT
ncbi:hypothetical protein [Kribbella catacumbae]|uniref:hypothetical protein n=1 Tax=Kribbella catacumbae TaxID=460086 RepID=UPI000369AC4A|nr:hypothetical protein [Kribbella catacumbae]